MMMTTTIKTAINSRLKISWLLLSILLVTSCFKPTSLASKNSPGHVEALSNSPVLSTETNCTDLKKGDQGHRPGPGMNHCTPSSESKQKVREMNQIGDH